MANQKRRHTLLRLVLFLLLVAVVGFGGWLGLSLRRVSDLFGEVSETYTLVEGDLERNDYAQALADARTAASLTSQAATELDGVQWDVASRIPVLGTDVETLRAVGSISGSLADDAVLPVLDAWDDLSGSGVIVDGQLDVSQISAKADQLVALAQTIQDGGKVVDDCRTRADALPASHFPQLDEWVGELRTSIATADETIESLEGVAQLVLGVSSAFSALTGA